MNLDLPATQTQTPATWTLTPCYMHHDPPATQTLTPCYMYIQSLNSPARTLTPFYTNCAPKPWPFPAAQTLTLLQDKLWLLCNINHNSPVMQSLTLPCYLNSDPTLLHKPNPPWWSSPATWTLHDLPCYTSLILHTAGTLAWPSLLLHISDSHCSLLH